MPTLAATNRSVEVEDTLEDHNNNSSYSSPTQTMTKDKIEETPTAQKEDPATVAASEELKHTSISDRGTGSIKETPPETESVVSRSEVSVQETAKAKATTPDPPPFDAHDEEMRERLSSPKKKRGRDQDEDLKDLAGANGAAQDSSAEGSVANGGRPVRLEPQKKRPRDGSEDRTSEKVETSNIEVCNPRSTTLFRALTHVTEYANDHTANICSRFC